METERNAGETKKHLWEVMVPGLSDIDTDPLIVVSPTKVIKAAIPNKVKEFASRLRETVSGRNEA